MSNTAESEPISGPPAPLRRRRAGAFAPPSPFRIQDALRQARDARERLLAIDPDMPEHDRKLYVDCLDGESGDAFAVLDSVIRASIEAGDNAEMAKQRALRITARKVRYELTERALRGVAMAMLEALGVDYYDRDDFSASVARSPDKAEIIDPERLPPKYRIPQPDTYDKRQLLADLKTLPPGERIEGAELSNGGRHLTVRS